MKLLTYNLLNPYHAVKWKTAEGLNEAGADNWAEWRAEAVLANIKRSGFDVLCVQEVSEATLAWLKAHFEVAHHALHETDEPPGAHGVAVLYNPLTVELLAARTYSSRPTQGEAEGPERVASSADVRCRASGRALRVCSVHLKGYNPYETDPARRRASQRTGDQELQRYLEQASSELEGVDGLAFLGDFNEDQGELERESSRQGVLMAQGFEWDGVVDITEPASGRKIDWVMYRALSDEGEARLEHARPEQDLRASDHALTGARLLFKP